jgi:hypothetical protein
MPPWQWRRSKLSEFIRNVHVPNVKSNELYATKNLQAILDLQCEVEMQTIPQLKDERKKCYLKNKHKTR